MKNILCVKNTVLLATMTRCASYPIADIALFFLATLKSCYRNRLHSVSTTNTWTVCIHFSSTASVAKLFSRVDNSLIICRGQFISTSKTEEWRENTQHHEKETLEGKVQKTFVEHLPKTKSTQTSGSVFADRLIQVKKTKFEFELIKIVDCFLDGHGNYTKNLVSFKIKSL